MKFLQRLFGQRPSCQRMKQARAQRLRTRLKSQLRLEQLERRDLFAVLSTFADLQNMSLNGAHTLANDIDATGFVFVPRGNGSTPFTGSFNGNGFAIRNLRIDSTLQYAGLFGATSGATLTNVVMTNVNIDDNYAPDGGFSYVGSLVGYATNTVITGVSVTGDVDALSNAGVYVGGLIGYSSNTIDIDLTSASSTATVDGTADANNSGSAYGGYGGYVGGLVGRADGLDFINSSSTGAIGAYGNGVAGGAQYAGGLVGYNFVTASSGTNASDIQGSSSSGAVTATSNTSSSSSYGGAYAGGLVGYQSASSSGSGAVTTNITNSTASGRVISNHFNFSSYGGMISFAGGLVGANYVTVSGTGSVSSIVTDASATGRVDANSNGYGYGGPNSIAGGLIGYNSTSGSSSSGATVTFTLTRGSATGDVYGSSYGSSFTGGLIGYQNSISSGSSVVSMGILNSSSAGHVTSSSTSSAPYGGPMSVGGGLIGYQNTSTSGTGSTTSNLSDSFATGRVDVSYNGYAYGGLSAAAGGLIGYNSASSSAAGGATSNVTRAYASGDAYGTAYGSSYGGPSSFSGGLIGYNNATNSSSGNVAINVVSSYALGLADNDSIKSSYGGSGPYSYAGGLIGYLNVFNNGVGNTASLVDQSFAAGAADSFANGTNGSTDANAYAGGLIGYSSVNGSHVGSATAGYALSTVNESYATGASIAYGLGTSGLSSYGSAYSGGLVGYANVSKSANANGATNTVVSNAYAWGNATAKAPPSSASVLTGVSGGLIGRIGATGTNAQVTNSYSIGVPSVPLATGLVPQLKGGLVGWSSNVTYTSDYWDTQTSGTSDGVDNIDPDPAGVTGILTPAMFQQATFAGWDFDVSGIAARDNGVWSMAGYPHLQAEWSGTIKNVYQLQLMALDLDATYVQANDVTITAGMNMPLWNGGDGFKPVGTFAPAPGSAVGREGYHPDPAVAFTGTYNGQNFQIKNLFINRTAEAYVGLFGTVYDARANGGIYVGGIPAQAMVAAPDAVSPRIQNTKLLDAKVAGGSFVGALAGRNFARVSNSFVTTTGNSYNDPNTSYVKGGGDRTNGTAWYGSNIGGFIGSNTGVIRDSGAEIFVTYNHVVRGGLDYDTHVSDTAGFIGDNNDIENDANVPIDRSLIISSYAKGSVVAQQVRALSTTGDLLNSNIGGYVGENDGYIQGTLASRSYASGNVTGYALVGGFAGKNDAPITWSYAAGIVCGSFNWVGGFAGKNEDDINDSYATGNVFLQVLDNGSFASGIPNSAENDYEYVLNNDDYDVVVGGFVGQNQDGFHDTTAIRGEARDGAQIVQSYALGNVSLLANGIDVAILAINGGADTLRFDVGGFVGYQDNNGLELIDQAYHRTGLIVVDLNIDRYREHVTDNSGAADSGEIRLWTGGFAGRQKRTVQQAYSASGGIQDEVGGLLDVNDIVIANYIQTGTTLGLAPDLLAQIGGLVGNLDTGNGGTLTNDFWDFQTNEPDHDALVDIYQDVGTAVGTARSKTTALMKTQATYTGWTFDAAHWRLDVNEYPKFWWQN